MPPLLSVVMPTYNGEAFVAAALNSLCSEGGEDMEVIVVDDGSSDRTVEIVREFAQVLPLRLIAPGRIGNWVAVTNIGLGEATAEWACFLHQDDLWLPGRFVRLRREMWKDDASLILHNAVFVGPDGEAIGRWNCPLSPGIVPPDRYLERLLIQNFIAIPSPVFRRKAVIDSGGMDEALWFSADWDLWLRLGAMGSVRFIGEALSAFRIHPASQTAAHKVGPNDWNDQLDSVLTRHLPSLRKNRRVIEQSARASIAVNSMLSAMSRGESVEPSKVALELLALGPSGWLRYVRDSRIVERVGSRLKAQHRNRSPRTGVPILTNEIRSSTTKEGI